MYEDDSDQDILQPWEIQEILIETLDEMESHDKHAGEDLVDEFEDTLEDQEINIIRMSQDPISSALHPLRHRNQPIETIVNEVQQSTATFGHMDGGSMATTTDRKELLFDLVPISTAPKLRVADSRSHTPTHIGKIYVQTTIQSEPIVTKCFYTPSMPVTNLRSLPPCVVQDIPHEPTCQVKIVKSFSINSTIDTISGSRAHLREDSYLRP